MRQSRGGGGTALRWSATVATALALATLMVMAVHAAVAAGPPYPAAIDGQRVYDTARIFTAAEIAAAEGQIKAIEDRTGAQVVVYTQVKPESDTPELAQADADALGNQWGVGRKGFDDGLVILFDMDESLCHGQVRLDAGKGFEAAFLSNDERQQVFEDTMLPLLRSCRMGPALAAALAKVDDAATPEHAARLELGRQVDAVLGLLVAPLLFVVLVAFAVWQWLRFGRDPVYLDDPSIHLPAPPAGLTPATAALIWDGKSSRHTLTTAMLDLASHGELSFREERTGLIIHKTKIGIETRPQVEDTAALRLIKRRQLGPAEVKIRDAARHLDGINAAGYLKPDAILGLGDKVSDFDSALEAHVVKHGWFREPPGKATQRWLIVAVIEGVLGALALYQGIDRPSQGLVLVGLALLTTALITAAISRLMPARTMAGAMIRAMLAAYRRTLDKTMAMARSMQQVVEEAKLDWLETPDQAVVWGVALGLQDRVQDVFERTMDEAKQLGTSNGTWFPAWYGGVGYGSGGDSGGQGGLMSSSAMPNFGGMMATIGTIGNSPSSSGGGGTGGGGGFGGGGAGGGF